MVGRNLRMTLQAAGLTLAAFCTAVGIASADPVNLQGTWSGGGSVAFASGAHETARCRATFTPSSATSYRISGTCATQSGKVTQQAEVFRMTADRYRGDFHNPEFDINGTISISVRGASSLTATLISSSGRGVLQMKR